MSHTPWKIEVTDEGDVFILDSTGYAIAHIGDMETADRYEFSCARKMAAAPELLEALREVILSLPDPVYSSLDDAGKLDRAHEAIAKATDGG